MAKAATYDGTYLTDPQKVKTLATWILVSNDPETENARRAMRTDRNHNPSPAALRLVYNFLYGLDSDPVGLIVAYLKTK
jgi:hypothetical protein